VGLKPQKKERSFLGGGGRRPGHDAKSQDYKPRQRFESGRKGVKKHNCQGT